MRTLLIDHFKEFNFNFISSKDINENDLEYFMFLYTHNFEVLNEPNTSKMLKTLENVSFILNMNNNFFITLIYKENIYDIKILFNNKKNILNMNDKKINNLLDVKNYINKLKRKYKLSYLL